MRIFGAVLRLGCCGLLLVTSCASGAGALSEQERQAESARLEKLEAQRAAEQVAALSKIEGYYSTLAMQKAAFLVDCPTESTEAQVLTAKQQDLRLPGRAGVDAPRITSIGVRACGQRLIFSVYCGLDEVYEAPASPSKSLRSEACDVVFDSRSALWRMQGRDQVGLVMARRMAASGYPSSYQPYIAGSAARDAEQRYLDYLHKSSDALRQPPYRTPGGVPTYSRPDPPRYPSSTSSSRPYGGYGSSGGYSRPGGAPYGR